MLTRHEQKEEQETAKKADLCETLIQEKTD